MAIDIKKIRIWLADIIFPKSCFGCGREGEWLCETCRKSIALEKIFRCPVCGQINFDEKVCAACRSGSFLNGLWAMADYKNPLVEKIIVGLKYQFVSEIAVYFDDLVAGYFSGVKMNLPVGAILAPIPLHRRRFLWRGFNQAELLAMAASRVLNLEVENHLLIRQINNQPQAKLKARERENNVRNIFRVDSMVTEKWRGRPVVLVDDVYTTGATMQEAARVLKGAGFSEIFGLVLARG